MSSKRKKRAPFTTALLATLLSQLSLSTPRDAAVWACATTVFWAVARIGEFTLPRLNAFDLVQHVTRAGMRAAVDRDGHAQVVFALPRTKSALNGEDVYWARQEGSIDPQSALENHLRINNPALADPLFAYLHHGKLRLLTRSALISRLHQAMSNAGSPSLPSHGLRIGGTLEYLLRGVPFDVVKAKGRWASDAFTLYLRCHAEIMAPYMQAMPAVHESFIRYAMPPVR
ncbi:hypothetical protein A0H81_12750 [Grifola frondosa]|uniref:Tyr recombinase domain-containing protein n=1 Tax=Grifola frondosa TaxID=5627 RepID=A0A1C7LTY6_GRIFR|nr:hypothetical protein A0H81_12750 [Grifola frondosa]